MQLAPRIALAVLFGFFAGAAPAPAQSAPSSTSGDASIPPPAVPLPPGMAPLFDGKTLEGWVQLPADSWTVKDGMIASRGVARGVIYTAKQYGNYRIIFDVRHVSGKPDHQPCVLFFGVVPAGGEKPRDALGAEQFIVPGGSHWDYRKGHNNPSNEEFTSFPHPKFDVHQWSRVEVLVNADKGTARMAVAQPVGSAAVEVVDFNVPGAGRTGPFALQMHNPGLFDEYANLAIEINPAVDDLITLKPQP
jgi:hypothetical protein